MQSASLGCKWSLELLFALIVLKKINAIVGFQTEWLYITKIKSAKWEETTLETFIWSEFWNVLCTVKSSKQLVEKNILFSQGQMLYSDPLATVPEVRIHLVYLSSSGLHTQTTRTSAIIREEQRQKMVRRREKNIIFQLFLKLEIFFLLNRQRFPFGTTHQYLFWTLVKEI